MPGDPRHHHYVPAGYLSIFTEDGRRASQLFVTDLQEKRQYSTTPDKTGKERDFYAVNRKDSGDRFVVEKWLGKTIDAHAPSILRSIHETGLLPTGDDFEWLMFFVASMILRGKFFRRRIDSVTDRVTKAMMSELGNDDESFKQYVESLPKHQRSDKRFSEARLREFLTGQHYDVSFDTNYHVALMLDSLPKLGERLISRNWDLIQSPSAHDHFVCSDNPVSIHSKYQLTAPFGPGFGMPHTLVFAPLSKRYTMVGSFELETSAKICSLERLAWINAQTAYQATRYVYSPGKKILWMDAKERLQGTEQFLKLNRVDLADPI